MDPLSHERTEIVFPPDHRVQVTETLEYPFSTIGRLVMKFPNGKLYSGTGTLINENHVVTCAHNLWGAELGGKATEVSFTPAQNGDNKPFGTITASNWWVSEDYVTTSPPSPLLIEGDIVKDYTKYLFDFGLVRLSKSAPSDASYCPMISFSDDTITKNTIRITGYPGDLAKIRGIGTMWTAQGKVKASQDDDLLFYQIDTNKGESGSALMIPYQNYQAICAIHVAGSSSLGSNFAVRLNQTNINTINNWMDS